MYKLSRLLLLLAVPVYAYCGLLLVIFLGTLSPAFGWGLAIIGLLVLAKKRKKLRLALDAHGTAFWARTIDLIRARMLGGRRGLILGRLPGPAQNLAPSARLKALFDRRLTADEACRAFFASFKQRPAAAPLIRMPPAVVHTACFAPAGAGKSTALVIPFLLDGAPDESCVVIDLKGELALATGLARHRMGHEIVILDPYGVVTQ